jgi:hypothetical protein
MYKYLVSKIINCNTSNAVTRKIFSIKEHAKKQFKEWKDELLEDYAEVDEDINDPGFIETLKAEYWATIEDDYVEIDGSEIMIERVEEAR